MHSESRNNKEDITAGSVAAMLQDRRFSGLYVFSSREELLHTHFQSPVRTDYFVALLQEKGSLHIRINLKDHHLRKGDFLVAPPSSLKQISGFSRGCEFTGLIFTPDYLTATGINSHRADALDVFVSGYTPLMHLTPEEARMIREYLEQIREKFGSRNSHMFAAEILQFKFLILLMELAALFSRQEQTMPRPELNRTEELSVRFAKLVMQHFKEKRKVKEYAELMFLTPKYLSEAVRQFTGKTAGELIDETIIQEARFLLLNPRLSIGDIADTLHFSNQSQFGKFFKHHTGLSPRMYRKNVIK